jgi:hypothetical protein
MSTLAEIEAAVGALSVEQEQELLQFLAARVNGDRTGAQMSDLGEFAGTLHLREDPLAWQQRARGVAGQ